MDYEKIASLLANLISDNWKNIAFFVQYSNTSYCMKFYVNFINEYIDCYSIFTDEELQKVFSNINAIIKPVYKSLDEKHKWNVMTLLISDNGNFKVEYDYKDISEKSISYIMDWKKKYLVTNKIILKFPENYIALAGEEYGRYIYETQVKDKIDISKDFYIEFPSTITVIASSFVNGFFHNIINDIGITLTEERLHIVNFKLYNKIKKDLILVD